MTDKKWYENIPENGVLCRYLNSDDSHFVHIIDRTDLNEFCLDYALTDDDIRPITPAEWWQFAPWQGIDSAPENTELLLLDNDGFIVPIDNNQ